MALFRVVAPCSLVEVYRRFRGACCLHHQGDESKPCAKKRLEIQEPVSEGRTLAGPVGKRVSKPFSRALLTHRPDGGVSKHL
jgi:hypothetical protein